MGWQATGSEAELPHEASTVAPDGPAVEEELNWSEQDPATAASDSQDEWEHLAHIEMAGGPPTSEPAVPEKGRGTRRRSSRRLPLVRGRDCCGGCASGGSGPDDMPRMRPNDLEPHGAAIPMSPGPQARHQRKAWEGPVEDAQALSQDLGHAGPPTSLGSRHPWPQ